jgi:c-di-GMP-binding flagellar brake protein YcgR
VFEIFSDEKSAIDSFFKSDASALHLRRKFQRLDMHLKVSYRLIGSGKVMKFFDGTALNLSAAGMYIYSKYTFPLNSLLDLSLDIPGKPEKLESSGRVIHLADKDLQPHVYPGMGVAFDHLDPDKESAIIDFIDKNVTHRADDSC